MCSDTRAQVGIFFSFWRKQVRLDEGGRRLGAPSTRTESENCQGGFPSHYDSSAAGPLYPGPDQSRQTALTSRRFRLMHRGVFAEELSASRRRPEGGRGVPCRRPAEKSLRRAESSLCAVTPAAGVFFFFGVDPPPCQTQLPADISRHSCQKITRF